MMYILYYCKGILFYLLHIFYKNHRYFLVHGFDAKDVWAIHITTHPIARKHLLLYFYCIHFQPNSLYIKSFFFFKMLINENICSGFHSIRLRMKDIIIVI